MFMFLELFPGPFALGAKVGYLAGLASTLTLGKRVGKESGVDSQIDQNADGKKNVSGGDRLRYLVPLVIWSCYQLNMVGGTGISRSPFSLRSLDRLQNN